MSDAVRSYLVTGDDPVLVSEALSGLLAELSEGASTGWVPVEEHGDDSDEDVEIAAVLDALATPPLLSSRRLVVLRGGERLGTAQGAALAKAVSDPVDGNVLVVVVAGKHVEPSLAKAVRRHGRVVDCSAGQGRNRSDWFAKRLGASSLRFQPDASRRLAEHLGEDISRLGAILEMLEAAYGESARIDENSVVPFLGEIGGAPPWELTDAIDRGDGAAAIAAAQRMMGSGGRHPLQLMASLHKHVSAMLRLDGSPIATSDEAAVTLKMSPYPAKKVLAQSRRLGHDRIARAVELMAEADIDLRGRLSWPPELVMEVLVARLAQLGRRSVGPA